MFENTAECDGAEDCPCLAGSSQALDNRARSGRPSRSFAGGRASDLYSPDYYEFQNQQPSFAPGPYYEDNEPGLLMIAPGVGNGLDYLAGRGPSSGVSLAQNGYDDGFRDYGRDPGRDFTKERQRHSRNPNGSGNHGYDPNLPQNSTRRKKFIKSQIIGMRDWYLVKLIMSRPPKVTSEIIRPTSSGRFPPNINLLNSNHGIFFFGAPEYFLGKRESSYGGYLKYSLYYTSTEKTHAIIDANVIIGGDSGYMVHDDLAQPPPFVNWRYRVRITEDNFTRIDGSAITKKQFMKILGNITSIYIRAAYRPGIINTRLLNVSLDEIVEVNSCGPQAFRGMQIQPPRSSPRATIRQPIPQLVEDYNNVISVPYASYYVPWESAMYLTTHYYTNTGLFLILLDENYQNVINVCKSVHLAAADELIQLDYGENTVQLPYGYLPCTCPDH